MNQNWRICLLSCMIFAMIGCDKSIYLDQALLIEKNQPAGIQIVVSREDVQLPGSKCVTQIDRTRECIWKNLSFTLFISSVAGCVSLETTETRGLVPPCVYDYRRYLEGKRDELTQKRRELIEDYYLGAAYDGDVLASFIRSGEFPIIGVVVYIDVIMGGLRMIAGDLQLGYFSVTLGGMDSEEQLRSLLSEIDVVFTR